MARFYWRILAFILLNLFFFYTFLGHIGNRENVILPNRKHSTSTNGNNSSIDKLKRDYIVTMMKHAWDSYRDFAFGDDELLPVSKIGSNWSADGSLLFTPIDAMDSLYIMDLKAEFNEAKTMVINQLDFSKNIEVNVFETTIRILGGLLSTYELDGDKQILKKGIELGDILLFSMNGSLSQNPENRIPCNFFNIKSRKCGYSETSIATAGTLQLEFQYLSDVTKDPKYSHAVVTISEQIYAMKKEIPGLYVIDQIMFSLKVLIPKKWNL